MSFVKRANYEGDILTFINSHLPRGKKLYGLTPLAVKEWSERANPDQKLVKYVLSLTNNLIRYTSLSGYGFMIMNHDDLRLETVIEDLKELV